MCLEDLQVHQHNAKLVGVTMATCLSAEPGRKAPYSNDLRWRIVWQKAGMELLFRHIARNLNISISTAHSVYNKFQETGDVSPKIPDGEGKRILTEQQESLDCSWIHLPCTCQRFAKWSWGSLVCRFLPQPFVRSSTEMGWRGRRFSRLLYKDQVSIVETLWQKSNGFLQISLSGWMKPGPTRRIK